MTPRRAVVRLCIRESAAAAIPAAAAQSRRDRLNMPNIHSRYDVWSRIVQITSIIRTSEKFRDASPMWFCSLIELPRIRACESFADDVVVMTGGIRVAWLAV